MPAVQVRDDALETADEHAGRLPAHALVFEPELVVPGSVRIEVTLRSLTEEAYLTLDGQVGFPMRQLDAIVVDRHPRSVRLLRVAHRGFFEILQRKLHWGDR